MKAPPRKILIIDDDPQVAGTLRIGLENANFQILVAYSGKEGLQAAFKQHPDLILLDIVMNGMDGFEVLDHLRAMTNTPVIMLTAYGQDLNRIRGLDKDASDFLPKGTRLEVLIATINKRLRDAEPHHKTESVRRFDGHLQVDMLRHLVWIDGQTVKLTPLQWRLFRSLVENEGRVATYKKLVNAGWESPEFGDARSVKVQISLLRDKLHDSPRDSRYIHTMREEGYMFEVRGV